MSTCGDVARKSKSSLANKRIRSASRSERRMQVFVKTASRTIILIRRLRPLCVPNVDVVDLRYHLAEKQAKRTIAQLKQVIAVTALKLVQNERAGKKADLALREEDLRANLQYARRMAESCLGKTVATQQKKQAAYPDSEALSDRSEHRVIQHTERQRSMARRVTPQEEQTVHSENEAFFPDGNLTYQETTN